MGHRRRTHLHGPEALSSVLKLVHAGQVSTRSELTERLGLTRARVGVLIGQLEELGLLEVDAGRWAKRATATGRPSHGVRANAAGPVVVVAQLRTDGFSVGLAELGGRLFSINEHTLARVEDPGKVLRAIGRASGRLTRQSGRNCVGAAIALPVPVTVPDGAACYPDLPGWPDRIPARQLVADGLARTGLDVPVVAANDAHLEALAEYRRGAGAGARHMLYVTAARRGVGGALVTDGNLYAGCEGLAMEIGHIVVRPGGRSCACGSRGCFGVETDPEAFIAAARLKPTTGEPDEVRAVRVLSEGGSAARRAAAELRERIGAGLAALADILAPDRIVLGGLHAALSRDNPEHLAAVVARHGWMTRHRNVPLLTGVLPHPALSGAAELAFRPLLDDPLGYAAKPRDSKRRSMGPGMIGR
jgi:predicted NBD/HSP70 family sugar kinase